MRLLAAVLIAFTAFHHFGRFEIKPGESLIVKVYSCSGRLETIYADPKLSMVMVNPLSAGEFGGYDYYSTSRSEIQVMYLNGKKFGEIDNCPE
jgi:hypothetical protein